MKVVLLPINMTKTVQQHSAHRILSKHLYSVGSSQKSNFVDNSAEIDNPTL